MKTLEIAKDVADKLAHGATDRCGNDLLAYESVFQAKAPELDVLTPINDMTREEVAEYAKQHELPLPSGYERSIFSGDANVYGRAVAGRPLENFDVEPEEGIYVLTNSPEDAPDKATVIKIDFEYGCPVKLDGKEMGGVELINTLSKIAGENGIGRGDVIHERRSGIRSRSIIEAPAPAVLIPAHKELESIVLTFDARRFKHKVEERLSQLAHDGLGFDPLKDALTAFVDKTQERVTGYVELKLYKGTVHVISKNSPYSYAVNAP